MPERPHRMVMKLERRVDRLANRLLWAMAGPRRDVETDVPIVSFTFDDVPDSALLQGAPILERHGVRGTFYIAGGLEGRALPYKTLISPEGCRELAERGHEIACHTFVHHPIRKIRPLGRDLDRNADFLRDAGVEAPTRNFAFPYNAAWPMVRGELRQRFRTSRAGGEAINRRNVDPMMLKSVEIRQPEDHAAGLTLWIDDVVAQPGWLIFFTHDVTNNPTRHGCTPETLDLLVGYAVEKGCEVLTVDAALDRIGW